jgi:hypothetical protein
MNLLSADLFRNFGIGFLAGVLIIGVTTIDEWAPRIESPARAAEPLQAPQPSSEFLIVPAEMQE